VLRVDEEGTVNDATPHAHDAAGGEGPSEAIRRGDGLAQPDDRVLETQLRAIVSQLDPVPDDAVLAARSAFAYLRLDAELAALVHDSATSTEPAGVRAEAPGVRQLSFYSDVAQVELEVVVEGPHRRLVGQCVPATTLEVVVRQPTKEQMVPTDDLGRFTVEVARGPVSLRCSWPHTDQVIETSWVSV
jgi:hypothetical protein